MSFFLAVVFILPGTKLTPQHNLCCYLYIGHDDKTDWVNSGVIQCGFLDCCIIDVDHRPVWIVSSALQELEPARFLAVHVYTPECSGRAFRMTREYSGSSYTNVKWLLSHRSTSSCKNKINTWIKIKYWLHVMLHYRFPSSLLKKLSLYSPTLSNNFGLISRCLTEVLKLPLSYIT